MTRSLALSPRRTVLALLVLSALSTAQAWAESRQWTYAFPDGRPAAAFAAEYVGLEGYHVILTKDGKTYKVPLPDLGPEDNRYVEQHSKPADSEYQTWTTAAGNSLELRYAGIQGKTLVLTKRDGGTYKVPWDRLGDAEKQNFIRIQRQVTASRASRPATPAPAKAAPQHLVNWQGASSDAGDASVSSDGTLLATGHNKGTIKLGGISAPPRPEPSEMTTQTNGPLGNKQEIPVPAMPRSTNSQAATGPGLFVGRWICPNSRGGTFTVTLDPDFTATSSLRPDLVGKWEYTQGEARVLYSDGQRHIFRRNGQGFQKLWFLAGSASDAPPRETDWVRKSANPGTKQAASESDGPAPAVAPPSSGTKSLAGSSYRPTFRRSGSSSFSSGVPSCGGGGSAEARQQAIERAQYESQRAVRRFQEQIRQTHPYLYQPRNPYSQW